MTVVLAVVAALVATSLATAGTAGATADVAATAGWGGGDGVDAGAGSGNSEPAAGVAGTDRAVQPGDAEVTDEGTYFVGQVLWTDAFDPGDDVTLRRADGSLVTDVPVDEDGVATVRTAGRVPGKYVVRAPGGPELAFELVAQEFGVSAPQAVAATGPDTSGTFVVASNRERYRAAVSSPGLSASDLRSLFGTGNRTDADGDGEAELVVDAGVETELAADFSGLDPGTYTFTFDVTDAAASDSVTVEVLAADPGRAQFLTESKVVVEERGDVARIPLALENAERATLTVGSDRTNWAVRLTAVDADGDGTVAVLLNTDLAGRVDDPALAFGAAGGDRVESVTRTAGAPFSNPDRRLAGGSYPLFLAVGGNESDVATLQLRDPGAVERSVRVGRARGDLPERAVVGNASAGTLELGSNVTVAAGDYLVAELRVAGVFGAIAAADDPSERPEGVSLRVGEVTPGDNEDPDAVDPGNFTVVPRPGSDRILLVADAGHPDFETGTTYRVTLTVTDDNPYVDATVSRSATFRVVPRRLTVDAPGGRVRVSAVEDSTVAGTTTLADGTPVTVTVRSNGTATEDAEPFLRSRTVVARDGTWSATFDFASVPVDQQFSVVVAGGGTATRVRGAVTRPPAVRITDQTAENPRLVTVDGVTLPDGGFVAVYDASTFGSDPVGSLLGSSGYLPPGEHDGIRVTLAERSAVRDETAVVAVVHRDTDGNRGFDYPRTGGRTDGPYSLGGDPVTDRAVVSPDRTPTATPTATDDRTPTATPTATRAGGPATPTATPTGTPTDPGTDPGTTSREATGDGAGGPGFGTVVALLAVLAAVLLGARRKE